MDAHTHHLAEAMQTQVSVHLERDYDRVIEPWCCMCVYEWPFAVFLQATQLGEKWSSELDAKLADQEHLYQRELAGALARLKGIESMVSTVADAGTQCYHWTACCYPTCAKQVKESLLSVSLSQK